MDDIPPVEIEWLTSKYRKIVDRMREIDPEAFAGNVSPQRQWEVLLQAKHDVEHDYPQDVS